MRTKTVSNRKFEIMNSTLYDGECDILLSEEQALQYHYTSYMKFFILVAVPVIAAFGVLGNFALLYVVYRVHEMRTVTNFYLSNLAISDVTLLISSAWSYLWAYLSTPVNFGVGASSSEIGCALGTLVPCACYFASVMLVLLVTFERYMAICHLLVHRMLKGTKWTAGMTMSAWIIALVCACFRLDVNETDTICIYWSSANKYGKMAEKFEVCKLSMNCSWCFRALTVIDFGQFALAVIASSYMYAYIIYTLSTRSGINVEHTRSKEQSTVILRTRNQIARMLILNGIVFFTCLAPFQLINVDHFKIWLCGEPLLGQKTIPFTIWLGRVAMLLNSSVNPLLYNVSNARYRNAFAEAFGRG